VRREIDYSLARRAVLRDYERGALAKPDVCDAHPELLRAARNLGKNCDTVCPICGADEPLRRVSYVYGDGSKAPNGRLVASDAELRKLGRSHDELRCYDVEVCLECSWNYMIRTYFVGRRLTG
jgi:hypothetical protein